VILGYAKKYVNQKFGLIKHKIYKITKYNSHEALIRRIPSLMGCKNSEELVLMVKNNTVNMFLTENFDDVVNDIIKNNDYKTRIIKQIDFGICLRI
jgi:hypothetical protein